MVSCLLIDQRASERQRIQAMLEPMCMSFDHCEAPDDGIRFCHEHRPDVVMMQATGLPAAKEFLRLVRYQGRNSGRPIVIMYSDKADLETMGGTILEGASEFLVGPFDRELLQFKLNQSGITIAKAA